MTQQGSILKESDVAVIVDNVHGCDAVREPFIPHLHVLVPTHVHPVKMESGGHQEQSAVVAE